MKKKWTALLMATLLACVSVIGVQASQGWDRTDDYMSGGGVSASIWNSCSDGTAYYPSGFAAMTEATSSAKLRITASGEFTNRQTFSYDTKSMTSSLCSLSDGAGIPTNYVRTMHFVNENTKVILSDCR